MDGTTWVQDYRRRLDEIGRRAATAQAALAELTATATSRDGAVTVTVAPSGALQRLALGERAEALSRVQLAEAVLATARAAHADAAARAAEAVAPLVGERSAAMDFLRSQLAAPEDGRR